MKNLPVSAVVISLIISLSAGPALSAEAEPVISIEPAISTKEPFVSRLKNSPLAEDAISKNIKVFTEDLRAHFAKWLSRYGRYNELIRGILADRNVPEEFVILAMIESGFSPYAYSRAKAVGPWQFISGTAKRYGLKMNSWVDERRDPIKSTYAAASYLGDLHRMFGSWGLAMAAYNAGEGAIKRALDRSGGGGYWDLHQVERIKPETKNYVPKFIAATMIVNSPQAYGFEPSEAENFLYDEVPLREPLDLYVAAKLAGTSFETLKELNPELTRWCTPPNVNSYILRVPRGTREAFEAKLKKLSPEEKFPVRIYKARKKDTLYKIAKRLKLPPALIAEMNDMKLSRKSLKAGQRLYVPLQGRYKENYMVAKN
jgi:membrane-bound lytic murein transglycosylase D